MNSSKVFTTLVFLISLSVFSASALALNITVSSSSHKVFMGDTVTISGKIFTDEGATGIFEYRAAVVGPKRVIVCDSNKTTTFADGTFSLVCKLPTAEEAVALGIPAASTRSVIPYIAGVAVKDTGKNETVKKHTKAILAVNKDRFSKQLDTMIRHMDQYIAHMNTVSQKCTDIAERAERFGLVNISEGCLRIQERTSIITGNMTAIENQAKQLKDNLNATDFPGFVDSLEGMKGYMGNLTSEMKGFGGMMMKVRWEGLKEIKKSVDDIRKDIEKKRGNIRGMKDIARGMMK
ncbi:MAG: hypothetical protein HY362_00585 [Candidatus Aenigmarchaeota archaeon]|nr:hypothetical protein [Candidatus Aenigmarchaeota archaeon]